MIQLIVGEIDGNDVIYIPEKDILFCKNTAIPYINMKKALLENKVDRVELKKDLMLTKDESIITLGCLVTTLENCKEINNNIKKQRKLWQEENYSK